MSTTHDGGCICGRVRYRTAGDPLWVTVCFCHFCQRATGGHGVVEPIFDRDALTLTEGTPQVYTHVSEGNGTSLYVHFCANCGTKLYQTFERWPERVGVYGGTFDSAGWWDTGPDTTRYIWLSSAAPGTMVPAGYPTYQHHTVTRTGTPEEATVLDQVLHVR